MACSAGFDLSLMQDEEASSSLGNVHWFLLVDLQGFLKIVAVSYVSTIPLFTRNMLSLFS